MSKSKTNNIKEKLISMLQIEYDQALLNNELGESNGYAHAIAIVKECFDGFKHKIK